MSELFLEIVNRSIAASWIVIAVLILRFCLKKAPKWVNVLLWGIVAVRLIFPFSIESALSLIPSAETVSPSIMMETAPSVQTGVPALDQVINPERSTALEISRLLRIHCHDFRRVHNGAASQCDNEIAAFLLGKMSSFLDDLLDRIRSDLIKQHNLHTCEGKLFHRTVKCAARSGRFPI